LVALFAVSAFLISRDDQPSTFAVDDFVRLDGRFALHLSVFYAGAVFVAGTRDISRDGSRESAPIARRWAVFSDCRRSV
jgi:hypothetical protein